MIQQNANTKLVVSMSADGKIIGDWNPKQFLSLLQSDAVKEMSVTVLPMIAGGDQSNTLTGLAEGFLSRDHHFRLKGMDVKEGVAFLHYVRDRVLRR